MAAWPGRMPAVPPKSGRGRPWDHDGRPYGQRDRVEGPFLRAKRLRRISARYDRLKTIAGVSRWRDPDGMGQLMKYRQDPTILTILWLTYLSIKWYNKLLYYAGCRRQRKVWTGHGRCSQLPVKDAGCRGACPRNGRGSAGLCLKNDNA